jgi:hypothetical protein
LKNPENKIKGIKVIGAATTADFASNTTLPINSPNEEPQKHIKKEIKRCKKNCC